MRVLVLTSSVSLADAALIHSVKHRGHAVEVFDVPRHQWVYRNADHPAAHVPGWLNAQPLRAAGNAVSGFYRRLTEGRDYDAVLACGVPAGGAAGRHVERDFLSILWSGDLDFAASRQIFTEDFRSLTAAAPCLFLENDYEFDKALSKGSRSAHLLHPPIGWPVEGRLLNPDTSAAPRVALFHPEKMPENRIEALRGLIDPVAQRHGGSTHALSVSSLYRYRDAQRGRPVESTVRTRLAGFTHVVLVGSSRDHGAAADLLSAGGAADRLIIEDTIAMAQWSRRTGFTRKGRGARLADLLEQLLTSPTPHRELPSSAPSSTPPFPDGSGQDLDPLALLMQKAAADYTADTEELAIVDDDGPVDVFFSTAPLEDRTNGARPQRVRNMAEAMQRRRPTVRMYSTPSVFERRARLVRSLLRQGRPAGLFYGENSTSPIPFPSTVDGLGDLLQDFRAAGGSSAWFVRDLHWLEHDASYLAEPGRREEYVRRGLRELSTVGGSADVLLAPSESSIEGFTRLLRGSAVPDTPWRALPPGVSEANVSDVAIDRKNSAMVRPGGGQTFRATLLYAGGIGSFYTMDTYLAAMNSLDPDLFALDFLVRPAEQEHLESFLSSHGLHDDPRVRILTDELDVYAPRTRTTIGTVLLDSDYARFSFPYKTVSFLEKGFPILTYRDMGIADFVEDHGIGAVCERSAASLAATLEHMVTHDYTEAIEQARMTQSWSERLATVQRLVESIPERPLTDRARGE